MTRPSKRCRASRSLRLVAWCALAVIYRPEAVAQELTPRAYWPAPVGTQVITIGGGHTSGDIVPDATLPITGLDSSINSLFVGYRRTLDLWGRTANLVLEMPFADGTTEATPLEGRTIRRDYQGFGDVAATLSVNLLGAPAMDGKQFMALRREPHPLLGASIKVVAPTGRYDKDRLINVGANRWAAKAELGYIQPLSRRWAIELTAGAWVFGDNDDFVGFTRQQDPIGSLQFHLVHVISPDIWVSLNANAYYGGRSQVGDRRLNDLQRDSRLGLTFVFPVAPRQAVKASLIHGSLNDSDETFNSIQFSYTRVF